MGGMAQAMTRNLVAKGNIEEPLILYNRTRSRAEDHSAKIGHSTVAATLEEAVSKSDIIWSCVQDQEAVIQCFEKILTQDLHGKLFLECSTISPEVTNNLARRVLGARGEFVAMPVFGEPTMAEKGLLVCVPAGAFHSVERIKPYLTGVVGRAVVDLAGEEPGQASLLKMIGNVMIMTTMETVAEVYVFAEKAGLGTQQMQKLMGTMFPNPPHSIYSAKMLGGDYCREDAIVGVGKAQALAALVLELATASKTCLKSYEVAVEHLAAAEAYAGPACDITGIYGAVRLESDLPFENKIEQDSSLPIHGS
ncbi:hypothetical protein MMC30_000749 [Trapelia coarctata]|nr:hypothetical protein [Trapelia coarctata]